MKSFLAIALCLVLHGCGGADAQSVTESAPAIGGSADGYGKGLVALRDVSGASGGKRGDVNTSFMARTISGVKEIAFEWTGLFIMDNKSEQGENVAMYAQANKFDIGPTWALVAEATDTTGMAGAVVAGEFDTFVTGPDNGNRMGLDIVCGDSRYIRGMGRSDSANCTSAIRIGITRATPWATWNNAIEIGGNILGSPMIVRDPFGRIVFEIKPNGDVYKLGVRVL